MHSITTSATVMYLIRRPFSRPIALIESCEMHSPKTMPMRDPVQWIARKHRLSVSAAALVIELAGLSTQRDSASPAEPSPADAPFIMTGQFRFQVERGVR